MKLLPDELQKQLLNILADARQNAIPNGVVFNAIQELHALKDAPAEVKTS